MARTSVVPVTLTGSDQTVYDPKVANGVGVFHGWSVHENDGTPAAATVLIRAGTTDTAPIIAAIELDGDASDTEFFDCGIQARGGIFVEIVAGTVEGAVYIS